MNRKVISLLLQLAILPLPWFLRKIFLTVYLKFDMSEGAKIGRSLILANHVILKEGAYIGNFTFVNNIDKITLFEQSKIGKFNWITGANSKSSMFIELQRNCELILQKHARVTDKHHIDCTAGVYIGEYTTVAGIRSQILTHSIDLRASKQKSEAVVIGKYCFIGTSSILLKGSILPDYSILGAGAIHIKKFKDVNYLYAGNPAKPIKKLNHSDYKYFSREHGHVA